MSWLDIALIGAVVIGAACGTALVVRRPQFWAGIAVEVWRAAAPEFMKIVTKRMTPEEEEAYLREYRAGRGEEWLRKRRGAPPKG